MSEPLGGVELSLEARAALALQLRAAHVRSVKVMRAIELAPRALFAPYRFQDLASRNMALPIGCGQTMPAAADLAWRIESLNIHPGCRVLEVGTGSGYAATVLSLLAAEVHSVERFETLAVAAARRIESLSVANVRIGCGDGFVVTRSAGLYDRIILHVAADNAPSLLLEALKPGGVLAFARRIANPERGAARARWISVERLPDGELKETDLGPCRLPVALAGRAGAL
ncbi:MAG TPA: protein-L-isoaspartate(D-aspartate) O-methyltransferase [Methylocystis sp.]|nr:protein-L-isoaspartate(D-aspartate) O-methyltransferase [Methylocystis sp.]